MEEGKRGQSLDEDDHDHEGSIKSNASSNNSTNSSPRRPETPSFASSDDEHHTATPTTIITYDGYDPTRIPSSVFASKSGKGIDWSVASNESLFSIHMGNNSFSRDQNAMLYKSGELPMLDQDGQPPPTSSTWQPPLPPSSPLRRNNNNSNPPPPINIMHVHVHVPNHNNVVTSAVTTLPPPEVVPAPATVNNTPAVTRNSTASSGSSTKSFQFPILQHEQMGRNNTQKVEGGAEQRSEKKTAEEEERNEEEMTHQNEKQSTEGKQQKKDNQQPGTSGSWTNCFGRSSWLACLPCFQKPPTNTTSSSSLQEVNFGKKSNVNS